MDSGHAWTVDIVDIVDIVDRVDCVAGWTGRTVFGVGIFSSVLYFLFFSSVFLVFRCRCLIYGPTVFDYLSLLQKEKYNV